MPKPKRRKKAAYTPPPAPREETGNPRWWVPTAVVLMIVGMLWVVTTYVIQSAGPIPGIGNWNLGIGFVLLLAGFVMTLRWH